MSLYKVLGVERNATSAKIKATFRKRSKDLHPDAGGSDKAFAELSFAYMVLRDKKRRARYDEAGEVDESEVNSDLAKISSALLSLFNAALQEGLGSRNDLDVIKAMRGYVKEVVEKKEKEVRKISEELVLVQKLADRIYPKDKKRNLFGSIIDARKNALRSRVVTTEQDLRLLKMVYEELGNYNCLVEVVRTVEMYFAGELTASTD